MKTCFKCGEQKPLSDFYKHPEMSDGHLNKCKECAKKDQRATRAKNIEYYREYDKKRFKESESRRKSIYVMAEEYKRKNEDKRSAHCTLNNAVRDGKILKPNCCEVCGAEGRIEGHHSDYTKPLDVVWMCRPCHYKWHELNGEGIREKATP